MKKRIITAFVAVWVMFVCFIPAFRASATYSNFSIYSNWNYNNVSSVNTKPDNLPQAYVNWTGSTSSTSHKEWFQVVSVGGAVCGPQVIFSYCSSNYVAEYSSVKKGTKYRLRARREFPVDPWTTVWGNWES